MDNHKFGRFIAQCRKENGWTQAELAERILVTNKAVSKWERGAGFPDIESLEPLAEALNISLVELMHAEKMESDMRTRSIESDAVSNVIDLAILESKIKLRNWMIGITLAALFFVAVFLIDLKNGWGTFLFTCFPILVSMLGVAIFCMGWYRRKTGQKFKLFFILGCILILFPIEIYIWSFIVLATALP